MNDQPGNKAIWALVLGILSLSGCSCFAAIPAIFLGWGEKSGVGRAGWILGCISLVLHVLAIGAALFIFLIAAVTSRHH
jgi:hypothetical protein